MLDPDELMYIEEHDAYVEDVESFVEDVAFLADEPNISDSMRLQKIRDLVDEYRCILIK
jgi:hypothetical protein